MAKSKGKGYVLAGGTDLLVQMKSGAREPGLGLKFDEGAIKSFRA